MVLHRIILGWLLLSPKLAMEAMLPVAAASESFTPPERELQRIPRRPGNFSSRDAAWATKQDAIN
jgi:hypothetical protein